MCYFFAARAKSDGCNHSDKNDSALHCILSYAVPGLTELRSANDPSVATPSESLQAVRLLPYIELLAWKVQIKHCGRQVTVFQQAWCGNTTPWFLVPSSAERLCPYTQELGITQQNASGLIGPGLVISVSWDA